MPPKPKGTGGKRRPARKKAAAAGGDEHGGPSVDDLAAQVQTSLAEVEREREQRNFFQLERDRINAMWEVTKAELEDARAAVRNKEREQEEMEERHRVELKVYRQRLKHVLHDHASNVTLLKAEGEGALKTVADEHSTRERDLQRDKRALKLELKELELSHEDVIRSLKQEHDKNVTKLRQEMERQLREVQLRYQRKLSVQRDELEQRRKNDLHEVQDRKNSHISDLMRKHERAFTEIKAYYNDITLNNLELIKSLKDQVEDLRRQLATSDKLAYDVSAENRRLTEPLRIAQEEVKTLKSRLAAYDKDKAALANSKARIKVLEDRVKSVEWENEVMTQRFETVQRERDELYEQLVSSIYDVQQKSGLKALLLEKKLSAVSETLERKEAQLDEVLAASNLDPAAVAQVSQRMDSLLAGKNKAIKDLQLEVARVSKQHDDAIRVYEAKMQAFGIPVEELGFEPLLASATTAPAGLVTG